MIIRLPEYLNANQFSHLFSGIVGSDRKPTCKNLTLDFSNLIFIEPTGITALSNLIHWLYEYEIVVRFTGYEHYSGAIAYLDDSQFFERYLGQKINLNAALRPSTKPLEFIQTSSSLPWLRYSLLEWITQNSGKTHVAFRELLVCLQEIFQNIRDHSGTLIGSVYAQYFPANGRLCISISDIGVGIPQKINKFLINQRSQATMLVKEPLTASSAIIKACQEGFTTSSHAGNAGRGLANLVLIITKYYNGTVIIISDNGYIKYSGKRQRLDVSDMTWTYPGCLIDIELYIKDIPDTEETSEDFIW